MTWLVVGLGNPGPEYEQSRHNIGFMVLDRLIERWGGRKSDFRSKWNSEVAQLEAFGHKLHLQKPMQYMNLSGGPVQRAATFFQLQPAQIIVIHDDIDLDFGRLKVKQGGGHGGHNGLRSISGLLGPDYLRVRGGVGRPNVGGDAKGERVVGHVLGPFGKAEQRELSAFLDTLAEAVEDIIRHGLVHAMNRHNVEGRSKAGSPASS